MTAPIDPKQFLAHIRDRCEQDFRFFVRYFFKHQKGARFQFSEHHDLIVDALMRVHLGETQNLIINCPPRYSKAIDCATPMWTPGGWVSAGDIQVGDRLLGSNGQWTTVIGVHPQGVKPAYNVRFSDGASLVACGDHRWSVRLRDAREKNQWTAPWQVKTTSELIGDLRESDGRKKWRIPVLNDQNNKDADLPIDPYLLGCWLGDGHTHYAAITTMDKEIVNAFAEYDPKPHTHQSSGKAITYGLRKGFVTKLRSLGVLKNKHIPSCYMLASHSQRMALLQGIADTDGWVGAANGQQGIASSNQRLSDDIRSLVNSLGGVWRGHTEQPPKGRPSHKTFLSMPAGDVAFRLPRKVKHIRQRVERNMPRRFVDSISPVTPREMVCFTVDAEDSLFCAGRDFVVTHNTELVVVMFVAWCYIRNPRCEFIHLSYADPLVMDNSDRIRAILKSVEFRQLWPHIAIRYSKDSKKAWETEQGGRFYATAAGGSVTGFGAGRMDEVADGTFTFSGCLLIDDPLKPDDARSDAMRGAVNRRWAETIRSRRNRESSTPTIVVMQRIHTDDFTAMLMADTTERWENLVLPAIIDNGKPTERPLWPEKHSIERLRAMRDSADPGTRRAFQAQMMQQPTTPGGELIKGEWFGRYRMAPKLKYRHVYADTAQKTAERNDFTVFADYGLGEDGKLYVLDVLRGKWESPDLKLRAKDFWSARRAYDNGALRKFRVEDKASGTGLIQDLKRDGGIPITGIPRAKDKYTRVLDVQDYIAAGQVMLPEEAPWVSAFIAECEAFSADDTHANDDQVDTLCDAISEMLATKRKGLLDL